MTTTERNQPDHPGLTIAVYRIDPVTLVRTPVRARRTVPPIDNPPLNLAFPPCRCPGCCARPGAVR
ncbi:hypothetical protein [Streptomyces bluensis]|uniref:Uncharacterized protein n=1 Tax=Streptomyces bluensis TaxID=33897 RepID=A0ABW6URG6_9ACTN